MGPDAAHCLRDLQPSAVLGFLRVKPTMEAADEKLPEKWKMRESPGRASCTRRCIWRLMLAFVGQASWLAWSSVSRMMSCRQHRSSGLGFRVQALGFRV